MSIKNNHHKLGLITTYFSKQFFSKSADVFEIPTINIEEYLLNNKITAVIVDNDLYEEDHKWYMRDTGGLQALLKLHNIKLFVVKNSDKELNNMFREYSIINIDIQSSTTNIEHPSKIINIPLIVDENIFNPASKHKKIDTLYLNQGKLSRSPGIQMLQDRIQPVRKEIVFEKLSRKVISDIVDNIKMSKMVYIYKPELLDSKFLKYIEIISVLQNTVVLYDSENIESEYALVNNESMNVNYMATIKEDSVYVDKLLIPLQRLAFWNHTFLKYDSNLENVLENTTSEPHISVITPTNRKAYLKRYVEQLNNQKNVTIEVILIAHGLKFSIKEREELISNSHFDIKIMEIDSTFSLGYCLNTAISNAKYSYIAKMDDDDYYFENYLVDSWIAKCYSSADLVGKHATFTYLDSTKIVLKNNVNSVRKHQNFVMGATFFSSKNFMTKYMFSNLPTGEDSDFLRRINEDNSIIYTDHPYNFCIFRSDNANIHTWKRSDVEFFKNAQIVHHGEPREIVAVD